MCGLVGMAGNITVKQQDMFRDMLIVDAVRGTDSTGVVWVGRAKQRHNTYVTHIAKEVGMPDNLFYSDRSKHIFNKFGKIDGWPKALLGHNRAATVGEVTRENAHPFEFDNIVGMHNGSLDNWFHLEGQKDFQVDSQALMNHIDKHGVESAWKNMLGAAAITVYDKKEDKIYLARNKDRPLYVAKSRDTIIWASERWMITALAVRREVPLDTKKENDVEVYDIVSLSPDILYTYAFKNNDIVFEKETKMSMGEDIFEKVKIRRGNDSNFFRNWNQKDLYGYGGSYSHGYNGSQQHFSYELDKDGLNWSRDTIKAGKDTANLRFVITGSGKEHNVKTRKLEKYWVGEFVDENNVRYTTPRLQICFDGNQVQSNKLDATTQFDILTTKTRLRVIKRNQYSEPVFKVAASSVMETKEKVPYVRVSYAGFTKLKHYNDITPTVNLHVITGNKETKKETEVTKSFLGISGKLVDKNQFWKDVVELGQSCSLCGEVFSEQDDFSNIRIIGNDICLCKTCVEKELTQQYAYM